MTEVEPSSVTRWRKRRSAAGFVRVEVLVRREDAGLIRAMAAALGDPRRESATRALLRERVADGARVDLKALLASAPLDGLDLERPRDRGRDVAL